jgi:hypothetical protein
MPLWDTVCRCLRGSRFLFGEVAPNNRHASYPKLTYGFWGTYMSDKLGTTALWLGLIAALGWIWASTNAGVDTEYMAVGTAFLVLGGIGARLVCKDSLE